jgi:alcohol dehydrogenase class IV
MVSDSGFEFCLGPRVIYGEGRSGLIDQELAGLGARRALLVTDSGVRRAELVGGVADALARAVELSAVVDDVPPGSSPATIEALAAQARDAKVDLIVALGGGTVIDSAKCARALAAGGSLAELEAGAALAASPIRLVAIPTTAGSGSEVSDAAYIYDESQRRRRYLRAAALAPDLALLDPLLTYTLPPLLTAATGMHALSHAVEAFESTCSSVFVDSLALFAIDLIANYLRDATHSGDDANARSALLNASAMAGIAFTNSAPGAVSALADAISGSYNIHSGAVHALLLPFVMQFNSAAAPNRYQRIARAMGIHAGGRAEVDVIGDSVTEVRSMAADCNLPLRLRDLGIAQEDLAGLAEIAAASSQRFNPRETSVDDLLGLLREAW